MCIGAGGDFVGCPSNSLYLSSGGLVGINTNSPNAELDVYGTVSATSFVGDGSGLTGVVASSGDRIVSGTNNATRMVAISDTGYISVTQAGANSAWFDPYRGLVTLGVSATGAVSATAGYFSGKVGAGTSVPTATLQVSGTFVVSVTGQTTTPSLVVNADGSIGIGNTGNATSRVRISEGWTDATRFTLNVEPSFRASADGSYYNIGIASTPAVFIDSGVSNSGYVYGSRSNVLRHYAGDEGRLAALTGQVIQFGHYNGTATGRITDDVRGLSIIPYAMNGTIGNLYGIYINNRATGGTITGSYFGLYQQDVNAKNYFGGRVGLGVGSPLAILDVAGTISASGAIQVGTSSLTCGAPIAGAIRYNSGSLQYCNSTTWTTLGASGGGQEDRIISGTTTIIASENTSLTFTAAGTQRLVIGADGIPVFDVPGMNSTASSGGLTIRQADAARYGSGLSLNATADNGGIYSLMSTGAGAGGGAGNFGIYHSGFGYRLYITSPTGNVGIGHNMLTPNATLQVSGTFIVSSTITDSAPSLFVGTNGLVGVGTNNPTVHGVNPTGLEIRATNGGVASLRIGSPLNSWDFFSAGNAGNGNFGIRNNANTSFPFYIVSGTDNVGISTTAPKAKLDVRGTISASDAIQVGVSSLVCGTPIGGAIRYSSPSLQVCNGSTWTDIGSGGGSSAVSSTGAVQFNANGNFGGDTDNFFWDNANKRLGIGVSNPASVLDISLSSPGYVRLRDTDSDGAMTIGEGTLGAGSFLPMVYGKPIGNSTALYLLSEISSTNDVGTVPSIFLYSRRGANAEIATRPVLGVQNYNRRLMTVAASGNVGIGTATPASTLQVSGSFTVSSTQVANDAPSLFVGTNGKVGIGTVGGSGALEVSGGAVVLEGPFNGNNRIIFKPSGSSGNTWELYPSTDNIGLYDRTNSVYRWRMSNDGNLGIGTNNPLAKLDVAGTISATDAIQVGSSSLACGAQIRGALRYNSTSNTMQVCNSVGWVSLASNTVSAGGTTAASSTGAIQFNAANAFGGDTANFFWDNANKRLGIGTSAPSSSLHVNGSVEIPATGVLHAFNLNRNAYGRIELYNGGNGNMTISTTFPGSDLLLLPQDKVGVGTSTPGAKLDVAGNISASGSVDVGTQVFGNSSDSVSTPTYTWTGNTNTGLFTPASNSIGFTTAGTERMRVWGANVGINTTAPSTSLYVNGQIGGGFGAVLTSGVKDWNDISNARSGSGYTLLRGTDATNAPTSDSYYFQPFSYEYGTKDGSGQLTQFAIPYAVAGSLAQGMYVRGRYSGTWTGWYQFPVIDPTGKMGINTNAPKASLDVVGTISASDAIQVGTSSLTCGSGITGAIRYTSATMQVCDGSSWTNIGVGMPAGTIAAFEATPCPSGWSEYTTARGRFLRGRDNGAGNDPDGTRAPGNVQADDLKSHTHEVYTDNSTAYVAGAGAYRATSAGAAAPDASGATGGTETRPKNVTVTFCRYNGYASSDMTGCPAGFTQIAAQGRSLGCMQTAEEASTVASWNVAADTCFTKYGGRLPRSQEWYIAMNNYALTGETGNWEWLDDYATVTSPFDGHATVGSTSISDFSYERDNNTTVAYRCFIQN